MRGHVGARALPCNPEGGVAATRCEPAAQQLKPRTALALKKINLHTQLSSTTHGTTGDRSREGRERKEVRLGHCGADGTHGRGDKEGLHRDHAVGFVDGAGEATSCSEANGLSQKGIIQNTYKRDTFHSLKHASYPSYRICC